MNASDITYIIECIGTIMIITSASAAAVGGLIALNKAADEHLPQKLATVIHIVHAVITEVLSFILHHLLRVAHPLFKERITPGAENQCPILLVHGYIHDQSAWAEFMRTLPKEGFGSIHARNLGSPFDLASSIHDHAQMIIKEILQIVESLEKKEIILVGHSMGGVICTEVASYFIDHYPDITIKGIVRLGAPLKGTPVAKIGWGQSARDLLPNSDYMRDFSACLEKVQQATPCFDIFSTMDAIVPSFYSELEAISCTIRQKIVNDVGHIGLLYFYAKDVASWIKEIN